MNTKELKAGIIIKTIAVLSAVYGLAVSSESLGTLTYFTTLSNIAVSVILFIFLIADILLLKSGGERNIKSDGLYLTKFLCTLYILITFLVFMFILAPTWRGGFIAAYLSGNKFSLCLHFITPLLAIIDFLLFDYNYRSKRSHLIFSVFPPLVYVLFVTILGLSGYRWGSMSAPYNFLNFSAPTGWFGFDISQLGPTTLGIGVFYMLIALVIIFILLGALLLKLKDLRRKSRESRQL